MLLTFGDSSVLQALVSVCYDQLKGASSVSSLDLQTAFRRVLRRCQPDVPQPRESGTCLITDPDSLRGLLSAFREESALDDFSVVFSEDAPDNGGLNWVQEALGILHDIVPRYREIIDIVVHSIFSYPSHCAGGGSTSAAIGCIWVDGRSSWEIEDYLEFLVHETTHNLLFAHELRHRHYRDYSVLPDPENFSRSAILTRARPLDKVVHSIIVGTEVLLFRDRYIGHPDSPKLHPPSTVLQDRVCQALDEALGSARIQGLIAPAALYLLETCQQQLDSICLATASV